MPLVDGGLEQAYTHLCRGLTHDGVGAAELQAALQHMRLQSASNATDLLRDAAGEQSSVCTLFILHCLMTAKASDN